MCTVNFFFFYLFAFVDIFRCSLSVEHTFGSPVQTVNQPNVHNFPADIWFQNLTYTQGGSIADLLQLESTARTHEDETNDGCSTISICDSLSELTMENLEGRPLLGANSSSSEYCFSSEMSYQSTLSYHTDLSSPPVEDNFRDFQTLLQQTPSSNSRHVRQTNDMYCVLCKRNGETREYYTTHVLKDNRGKVICPVLRKYVCPRCRATEDNAHTLRHCPFTESERLGPMPQTLQTAHSSRGRHRVI